MTETERLVLRHWRTDDAETLYRYASDAKVSEMAMWPRHTSPEMSMQVIKEIFMPNTDNYAIALKDTDEAVGCIGLVPAGDEHHSTDNGEREVGYWIGAKYWGRGMTTEALRALTEHYRKNCPDIRTLLITTDRRNKASQRVAEKCGFVHVEDYELDGTACKAYRLSLD